MVTTFFNVGRSLGLATMAAVVVDVVVDVVGTLIVW